MSAAAKVIYGGVAQLGERLLCKQEVTGSIPVVSTNSNAGSVQREVERLRNVRVSLRFGRYLTRGGAAW
jgi:hypothetical protein